MRKTLLLVAAVCMLHTVLYAQNPILNSGFENWTFGDPDHWTANNLPGTAVPVLPYSGGHSGNLGAFGVVTQYQPGIVIAPVLYSLEPSTGDPHPVSQAFSNFSFYYCLGLNVPSEFFNAMLIIQDAAGNAAGYASIELNNTFNTNTWTLASIPITYMPGQIPASALITFTISDTSILSNLQAGSFFRLDDVSLNNSTSGIPEQDEILLSLYPNPSDGVLQVPFRIDARPVTGLEILDISGRMVQQKLLDLRNPGSYKEELDVRDLPSGFYQVILRSADNCLARKAFVRE